MYIDLEPLIKKLEPKKVEGEKILGILKYGEHEDSMAYIKSIEKKAEKVGVKIIVQDLKGVDMPSLKIKEIEQLVDYILPIKPFPQYVSLMLEVILDRYKDIDNFTNESMYLNCTAEAVLRILEYLNIDTNRHVLVIGRHVGLEVFKTLLQKDYTCTIVHSKTNNLEVLTRNADVIISATEVKGLIKKDMIKVNSMVIDVGLGDVEKEVIDKAYVTPIQNGVGAVTTAILFKHILEG